MKNGYELMAEMQELLKDCIYVSNDRLPDEFQDHRTDGVSLRTLERKCDQRDAMSEYEQTCIEKAKRVDSYAADIANGREIQYISK